MFKIKDAWQIVEEVSTEGTWTDVRDGQVYPYKQFGNQIWMTVNFNYGGKQGDWVPHTTAQSEGHAWRYQDVQDYENWNSSGIDRGAFYTRASLASWVVPEGWHIPTKAEWDTLVSWAVSEYGDASKARPALMVKTTKWRAEQTLYSWDDFGLAGFNMIPGGYMGSSTAGTWGDSSLAWNACVYWAPNSSIATDSRVEKTMFNSNTSILFRDQDSWSESGRACTIRLIKDSGVYVPQPAISTITTTLDSTGSDNKIATEKATRSAITSAVSSKMSNPMTATGDLIVGGTSGVPEALSAGAEGKFLKITSGVPAWGDGSYLGAFSSSNRPQNATSGQYIMDTDLGYFIYKYNDTWINASGFVVEGTPDLSQTKLFKIRDSWQISDNIQTEGVWIDTRDGQSYPFKKFGNQIWMTVNFNYGGAENEFVTSSTAQTEGHAWRFANVYDYNNFESQSGWSLGAYYTAGSLDNWVVPTGWHLPTRDEVNQLVSWATTEYGSENNALTALATDTTWWGPTRTGIDENLLNDTTFNLSPCSYCSNGNFNSITTTYNNDCHIWIGEKNGSARYYFKIGLNNTAGYTMKKEFTSTTSSFAFPIRLVYDLSTTTQPVINEVTTEVNDTPSDNKLPTEKATKTYVDNAIPPTCQENYPFIITNKKDSMTNDARKIFLMKIISKETATRTKFGFYHVSGNRGGIIMGIYNKLGELMAQTGQVDCSTAANEEMLWFDSQNPFVMENGEEYWLAFLPTWPTGIYDNSIAPAQYQVSTTTTAEILSLTTLYTDNTTLPATKPSGSYNTTVIYMAVK